MQVIPTHYLILVDLTGNLLGIFIVSSVSLSLSFPFLFLKFVCLPACLLAHPPTCPLSLLSPTQIEFKSGLLLQLRVSKSVFLNWGSSEPWGSVGVPQGFPGHPQRFNFNICSYAFTWKDGNNGPLGLSKMAADT